MASKRGQLLDGVLLLDKPAGLSSNHALQRAKRSLDARKAGHTGTLDPFATGLLVCCFGRATKIAGAMLAADKTYLATLSFGSETDSGDLTGNIVAQKDSFAPIEAAQLESVLVDFRGEIQQIPPMVSALKHAGKPLYKYAREGIELERPARTVNIFQLQLLAINGRQAELLIHCSKGTYIRTLAQDIGRKLACYAHLSALRRTQVGPFTIEHAIALDRLQAMPDPISALIPLQSLPKGLYPAKLSNKENDETSIT